MGLVLTIANNKGGVGKTLVTLSVASTITWLQKNDPTKLPQHMRKAPILVVDTDPQANTTEALGIDPVEVAVNILELYENPSVIETTSGLSLLQASPKHKNIVVVPSSIKLESISNTLPSQIDGRTRLKDAIDRVRDNYSLIIIDTPPSLGIFTQNAVVAADNILIPLTLTKHALLGVSNMLTFLVTAKKSQNPRLNVLGLLVNAYDKRYRLQTSLLKAIQKEYDSFSFDTIIPTSSRMVENIAARRNLLHNIPADHRAILIDLLKELFHRVETPVEFHKG